MRANKIKNIVFYLSLTFLFTSCYSYTSVVGVGAYGNIKTTKWNHYFIFGSIRASVSDSKDMARGAKDYTVHTRQTFVNWLISTYTFGLYTPTTTTVTVRPKTFKSQKE